MITLARAKEQCRVRTDDEDDLIAAYILAARDWVERYTRVIVDQREIVDRFNAFDTYLSLSRAPVIEVTEIAYTDTDGAAQTVTGFRVQNGKVYAPTDGWPSIEDYSTIEVSYDAGYGPYDEFPEELNLAMLLLVAHWYDNRAVVDTGNGSPQEVPFTVEALAGPFRLPTIA